MNNNFYDIINKFYKIYYPNEKIIIYEIVSLDFFVKKYIVIINNLIKVELSFNEWDYMDLFNEEYIFSYIEKTNKQFTRFFKLKKINKK